AADHAAPLSRRPPVDRCLRFAHVEAEAHGPPFTEHETRLRLLSHRESQILRLASNGSTNSQIGARLGLTVHAVKFHLASVYRKLGVANRTEAAVVLMTGFADVSRS